MISRITVITYLLLPTYCMIVSFDCFFLRYSFFLVAKVDSPYSLGMFVFDVYFPAQYPNVPPLVTFMTTGGGQVRFNPNLYVDGKVCLSLLGLTYSSDKSQRWTDQSSLAQILLSMQSQIFGVKEPYFNEGSGKCDSLAR
jgi:ubiquitin-protein ligase